MGVLFFPKVETNNLWLCAYFLIFLHYLSSDRIMAMKKKRYVRPDGAVRGLIIASSGFLSVSGHGKR